MQVPCIKDVVRQGKLVDLTNDYRTASIVRMSLPDESHYAMTASAFRQHLQQRSGDDMRTRVYALCSSLNDALRGAGKHSAIDFEYRFFGGDRKPQSRPLKMQWFAPNNYWVILLPDEDIRRMDDASVAGGSASPTSSPL